jgi:hypothetical protein
MPEKNSRSQVFISTTIEPFWLLSHSIMDPLSISTAVVTFAGAALSVTKRTREALDNWQNAVSGAIEMSRRLKRLQNVLQNTLRLEAVVQSSSDAEIRNAGLSQPFIEECLRDLRNLDAVFAELQRDYQMGGLKKNKALFSWAVMGGKRKAAAIAERLEGQARLLDLALNTLQG